MQDPKPAAALQRRLLVMSMPRLSEADGFHRFLFK